MRARATRLNTHLCASKYDTPSRNIPLGRVLRVALAMHTPWRLRRPPTPTRRRLSVWFCAAWTCAKRTTGCERQLVISCEGWVWAAHRDDTHAEDGARRYARMQGCWDAGVEAERVGVGRWETGWVCGRCENTVRSVGNRRLKTVITVHGDSSTWGAHASRPNLRAAATGTSAG